MTAPGVAEIRDAIAASGSSASEQVRACLARIAAIEGASDRGLGAFTRVHGERALARAEALDARIKHGESPSAIGPLAGVPVAVSDAIGTGYQRLEAAGAVIVASSAMSAGESAIGNPWDPTRDAGDGSAAAVASGAVPAAVCFGPRGTIARASALSGAVGLTPSSGAVPPPEVVASGPDGGEIGPVTRSVGDAALLFDAVSGSDRHELHELHNLRGLRDGGIPGGVTLAVPASAGGESIDPRARLVFGLLARALGERDVAFEEVELASAAEVRAASLDGGDATPEAETRRLIRSDYQAIFDVMGCDAVLAPAAVCPAREAGGESDGASDADAAEDAVLAGACLAGLPVVSIPAGFVPEGDRTLPIGVHLIGPEGGDARVLRVAHEIESVTGFAGRCASA
ncbi:MAG: amidase family protein [Planctomycetota bacterium]